MYKKAKSVTVNTVYNFSVHEIDEVCIKNGFEQMLKLKENVTFCSTTEKHTLENISRLLASIREMHPGINEDNLTFRINY